METPTRTKNPGFTNSDTGKSLREGINKIVSNYRKNNPLNPRLKGNRELYIKSALMLFLFICPYIIFLIYSPVVWIAIPLLFVLTFGMVGSALNIMHDAAHGAYSASDRVNKYMSMTIYLQGAYLLCWRIQHNLFHHMYTNIKGLDGDIEPPYWLLRFSKHSRWLRNHQYQHRYAPFAYGFLTLGKFFGDFASLIRYSKMDLPPKYKFNLGWELVKAFVFKTVYIFFALVMPILVTDYTWWQVMIGFFLVHYFSSIFVSFVFQTAHVVAGVEEYPEVKEGEDVNSHITIHAILTTCGWKSKFLSWYAGGLNNQVLHHILYRISHVHYPYLYKPIKELIQSVGLVYNEEASFFKACRNHLEQLRIFGIKPEQSIKSSV